MTRIATDAGGRDIFAGSTVRFCDDVAHLYETGKSELWTVQPDAGRGASVQPLFSKAPPEAQQRASQDVVLRVLNSRTDVWAFAPARWVSVVDERTSAEPWRAPGTSGPLRDLAMTLFMNRNATVRDIVMSMLAWGVDHVHKTNPPLVPDKPWNRPGLSYDEVKNAIIQEVGMMADRRTPEMQAALDRAMHPEMQAPLRTRLMFMLGAANIGCQPTDESVEEGVRIAIDNYRARETQVAQQSERYLELEQKYNELKQRVDDAVKAFGA